MTTAERRAVAGYLATLRRVPPNVVRAVATRNIVPSDGATCLCGWFVREMVAQMTHVDADAVDPYDCRIGLSDPVWNPRTGSQQFFGGTREEWIRIYVDIISDDDGRFVEEAFARRVAECVR